LHPDSNVQATTRTAGANDHKQILPVLPGLPRIGDEPGRPKELSDEVCADRGFGGEATRALLRWLGIVHIVKRRTPHGSGLGKVRWVAERTISRLKELRRVRTGRV
jgi:transposase